MLPVKDICPFTHNSKDYVVIINNEASPTKSSVDSELLRYNLDDKKWVSVQKIKTTGALDCELFSFGQGIREEKFLAIANNMDKSTGVANLNVNSVIYKFSGEKFVPFQCLKTIAATQIKAKSGENSSFVLAVANLDGVEMYQYNGWKLVKASVQSRASALGKGVVSMTVANLGPDTVLIVSNSRANVDMNVFQPKFRKETVLKDWRKQALGWCQDVKLKASSSSLEGVERKLDGVYFVDQQEPIRIKGDLIFRSDVEVTGTLSAPQVFDTYSKQNFTHEMTIRLQQLDQHLQELERNASRAMNLLSRALRLDGNC